MNDLNENLQTPLTELHTCKQRWRASLPYPKWPFGIVPGEQLVKYAQQQRKMQREEVGEALM